MIKAELQKNIGKHIRNYREMKGLSRKEFARKAHLSWQTVKDYENGKAVLELGELMDIWDAMGRGAEDLAAVLNIEKR